MRRTLRISSLVMLAVACGGTSDGFAQAAPRPSIFSDQKAEAPAPVTPRSNRPVSSEAASLLSAAVPKYTPPPPKPEPKPEEELVDARDVDRPRNGIIRLPRYIVQEPKPPVFTERAISTDKGIRDIAVRRYITDVDRALNRFTVPLFGTSYESRAMAMYAEDERLKNIADMKDAATTVSHTDAAQGAYILRETNKTYLRTSDFGWQNPNKK